VNSVAFKKRVHLEEAIHRLAEFVLLPTSEGDALVVGVSSKATVRVAYTTYLHYFQLVLKVPGEKHCIMSVQCSQKLMTRREKRHSLKNAPTRIANGCSTKALYGRNNMHELQINLVQAVHAKMVNTR
jgi:hypothetical protein